MCIEVGLDISVLGGEFVLGREGFFFREGGRVVLVFYFILLGLLRG